MPEPLTDSSGQPQTQRNLYQSQRAKKWQVWRFSYFHILAPRPLPRRFSVCCSTLRRVKFLTRREATRLSFNAKRRDGLDAKTYATATRRNLYLKFLKFSKNLTRPRRSATTFGSKLTRTAMGMRCRVLVCWERAWNNFPLFLLNATVYSYCMVYIPCLLHNSNVESIVYRPWFICTEAQRLWVIVKHLHLGTSPSQWPFGRSRPPGWPRRAGGPLKGSPVKIIWGGSADSEAPLLVKTLLNLIVWVTGLTDLSSPFRLVLRTYWTLRSSP